MREANSGRKALATARPTRIDNCAAGTGRHARTETVASSTLECAGLKCTLHDKSSLQIKSFTISDAIFFQSIQSINMTTSVIRFAKTNQTNDLFGDKKTLHYTGLDRSRARFAADRPEKSVAGFSSPYASIRAC